MAPRTWIACIALVLVGCSATSDSTASNVATTACADDAVAAATTYLEALASGDVATSQRCDHQPTAPSSDVMDQLKSEPWRFDASTTTDQVTPSLGADQIAVRVPLPDQPRSQQPPIQSGVTITTTLEADGSYYVTAVLFYVST